MHDKERNLFVITIPKTRASWESSRIRNKAADQMLARHEAQRKYGYQLNFQASCGDLLGKVMDLNGSFRRFFFAAVSSEAWSSSWFSLVISALPLRLFSWMLNSFFSPSIQSAMDSKMSSILEMTTPAWFVLSTGKGKVGTDGPFF